MKTLVVVPTYNEKDNIQVLVPELLQRFNSEVHVLVVDDNSPDGTGDIVRRLQQDLLSQPANSERLHLLSRAGKQGLGKAYLAGFQWGLEKNYDAIVEMDADFSHRPQDLSTILQDLVTADFVVGSRYVAGGQTVNWGLFRKIISKGGSLYSRWILGYPVKDWTGGFNAWKSQVLRAIDLSSVRSEGYSFQIELKYKALRKGFRGVESAIVFEDRRVGQSKMSLKIVLEAFYRVWLIRFY
ncbi:MAG: polyprenol monophosphomannose synthase [Pseudobdellovibrionaceae bacterium]